MKIVCGSPMPYRWIVALQTALFFVIAGIALAQPVWHHPDEEHFSVRNLVEVNSAADDYAPWLVPNRGAIYFTSSRSGDNAAIYHATLHNGIWQNPQILSDSTINDSRTDRGSFSAPFPIIAQILEMSADELRQQGWPSCGVVTLGRRPENMGDADILTVRFSNEPVGPPKPAGLNSIEWDAQGTMTPDGMAIIFASARDGGEGDMDLWLAHRDSNGIFGEPANLGSSVNTSDNEFSPFLDGDGRTLFFASTGHSGFGGADIFVTRRDDAGNWSAPRNLGERINTQDNELFFAGFGSAFCFFASDRAGGSGGLDIYEGTPNIFAPSQTLLKLTARDTTTGTYVPAQVVIKVTGIDRVVARLRLDSINGNTILLPSGLDYVVEASSAGMPSVTLKFDSMPGERTYPVTINFGSTPPEPVVAFDIDGVNVPLYVSGYYRINTPESLRDLRRRQMGDMRGLTYISDVAHDTAAFNSYDRLATNVSGIIDGFYRRCIDDYLPAYIHARKPGEVLEIRVTGFADPRPILGVYREAPVTFMDSTGRMRTMRNGERLDNFRLAGLRAHYAMEYLRKRFELSITEGHPEYQQLVAANAIRWVAISGNVDTAYGGDNLAQKRRVLVEFSRVMKK